MEGRIFAIISSIIAYLASYFFIFYLFSTILNYKYSESLLTKTLRKSIRYYLSIIIVIICPLIISFFFIIGGYLDLGKGILWGCYLEDFIIVAFAIWVHLFLASIVLLIIGLKNPSRLGFVSGYKTLQMFFLQNIWTFLIVIIAQFIVPKIASSLSGIDSSCL